MRRNAVQLIVIGVIASAIGIAIAFSIHWFPKQASSQAKEIDALFHVLLVASIPIFVLVEVVVLFSVWKFRMRPGQELEDGPPIHGDTRLEIIWTAVPALLIIGIVTYTGLVLHDIEKAPAKGVPVLAVNVIGQQFAWSYEYPQGGSGKKVVANQLYLPDHSHVRFRITSKDVIHAFFVPEFRLQEDAVPGQVTSYRVTTRGPGTYPVVCNELCGIGHSTMRSTVHILPRARFESWLASQPVVTG